jgi:hypothetical protein
MWPGDQQSGGQQYPQGNPPQNPQQSPQPQQPPQGPYGQPNPYAQPGYPQQQPGYPQAPPSQPQQTPPPQTPPPHPAQQSGYQQPPYGPPANPYAQPGYPQQPATGGYQNPQTWSQAGQPGGIGGPPGPPPQKDNRKLTIGVAITAAIAVVAAVTVGAVYLTGGHDKKNDAKNHDSPTPTATVTKPTATPPASTAPGASGGADSDDPRGSAGSVDVKPVIPGWKVVRRGQRNVAFDVPPDWTVDTEGMTIGYSDKKGDPQVAMSAPAYYKHEWCKSSNGTADRAVVGTKGGSGAKSLQNAAETEAESWAYWVFQDDGKGTFSKARDSRSFTNAQGISGWQAEATATKLPKADKCSPPGGTVYTVAWLDPSKKTPTPVVWVLYADAGVSDQLAQSVVDKIKSTIRPLEK